MKKMTKIIAVLLAVLTILAFAGCSSKKDENPFVGVWEHTDSESGLDAVYDLKEDKTGTYTLSVGGNTVVYELKYEEKDGLFLVTFVNNEIFSEEDVFENEYRFENADTMVLKDTFGQELYFYRAEG